jgi:AAA domain-containing protein
MSTQMEEVKADTPEERAAANKEMANSLQAEFDRRTQVEDAAQAIEREKAAAAEFSTPKPKSKVVEPPKPAPPAAQAPAESAPGSPCPFVAAEKVEKRPKILLWGDSGSGKTTLALQFPKPVVIDMERGTESYGEAGGFHVVHTQDVDRVRTLVDWLRNNKHDFRTLVIDPITIYWEALQRKWSDLFLKRNKTSKGFKFEYYDFQPKDWMQMRDEYQALMRAMMSLDMGIVVTAHAKAQYADGEFMKKIGDTFDSQKKTPYLFDVVVQLTRDESSGKHFTQVVKERAKVPKLPREKFETSYTPFAKAFGAALDKPAKPFAAPNPAAIEELWRLAREYGLSDSQVRARLETYGSGDPEELSAENVAVITEKLKAAVAAKAAQASKK